MGWLLPTGFEDPGGEWDDEVLAFDADDTTRAVRKDLAPGTWSDYLILLFPAVEASYIYFHVGRSGGASHVTIQSWEYPYWKGIVYQVPCPPDFSLYVSIWLHTMTRVRIRFFNDGSTSEDVYVYGFTPEAACSGPLVNICNFLRSVGTFFIDLSLDIAQLWAIGGFLCTPFELLGELFYAGADICCSTSGALQMLLDTVAEGITADAILALILENWPTLYYLITDPVGWFLVQLTLAFDLEPWHTQSLEFLAKWVVETYFPTLYHIWLDPEDWFSILLEDRFPILYYLAVDPIGEILYLIGQAFDLTPWEAQSAEFIVKTLFERYFLTLYQLWLDPEDWLVEHVDPRILGLPAMVAAFFDDPWGWMFDKLEDQIEAYAERIGEISLEIIARLLGV